MVMERTHHSGARAAGAAARRRSDPFTPLTGLASASRQLSGSSALPSHTSPTSAATEDKYAPHSKSKQLLVSTRHCSGTL